jgi:D-serine deaminase-like pyridoxal phosphate-dependent protein
MLSNIKGIQQIDSPALLVFPEIVERNIAEMVRMVGDVNRLRPHIKTHKTSEGINMMQAAGINKFKCATIAEAELLGLNNAVDVILAHQLVGPKIERLYHLTQRYPNTKFSTITDNINASKAIGEIFYEHGHAIAVYIDINVGMNRTGITPGVEAIELYESIIKTGGLKFGGLHVYDGQHRQSNPSEKEAACNAAFEPVLGMIENLQSLGYPKPIIVAGGSPSFSIHASKKDRDCSPGTNIFWDHGYKTICPEQAFESALYILTRVISLPSPNKICIDLGHKAVAAENDISKRVVFPAYPDLKAVSQSEEHLVLEIGEHDSFEVGDVLIGIPYHVCPTVALHEFLTEVKNNEVTGEWQVLARRRKINC